LFSDVAFEWFRKVAACGEAKVGMGVTGERRKGLNAQRGVRECARFADVIINL
jgi:hypothetical protein